MKIRKNIYQCQSKPIDDCCFMDGCGFKCACDITEQIEPDQWLIDYSHWLLLNNDKTKSITQLFHIWFKQQNIYKLDEINNTIIQK